MRCFIFYLFPSGTALHLIQLWWWSPTDRLFHIYQYSWHFGNVSIFSPNVNNGFRRKKTASKGYVLPFFIVKLAVFFFFFKSTLGTLSALVLPRRHKLRLMSASCWCGTLGASAQTDPHICSTLLWVVRLDEVGSAHRFCLCAQPLPVSGPAHGRHHF